MQAPIELISLLSRGVPMAKAKKMLGLDKQPPEESVSAGISGGKDKAEKAESTPADTSPADEAEASTVDVEAKPAWMP